MEAPWEVAAACTVAYFVENRPTIKNCLEKKDLKKKTLLYIKHYSALLAVADFVTKIS